jgi:hypothetical protein
MPTAKKFCIGSRPILVRGRRAIEGLVVGREVTPSQQSPLIRSSRGRIRVVMFFRRNSPATVTIIFYLVLHLRVNGVRDEYSAWRCLCFEASRDVYADVGVTRWSGVARFDSRERHGAHDRPKIVSNFGDKAPTNIAGLIRLYRILLSGQGFEPRVTARRLEATSDNPRDRESATLRLRLRPTDPLTRGLLRLFLVGDLDSRSMLPHISERCFGIMRATPQYR